MARLFQVVVLVLGAGGCLLSNVSTAEKLREAVEGANSEARWGRLDLASQRVHPSYRAAWASARRDWQDEVQIADSEVTSLRLDDDQTGAVSMIVVEWYRYDTMTLRESTIRQTWDRVGGTFALLSEEVVDGDEELFAEPEEPEEDDEAEEENETGEDVAEGSDASTSEEDFAEGSWVEPTFHPG